jgi:hypothetical protein
MTDQTQLAIITADVQNLIATGATLEQISAHLAPIYDAAENAGDTDAMRAISIVWENTQALAQVAENATTIAQSAVAVANEMLQQRDAIADDLATTAEAHRMLKEAIETVDTDHPIIRELHETIEEGVWEYVMETEQYREGIHEDEPETLIEENGHFGESCEPGTAVSMVNLILGYGNNIPDEMYERLGTFITEFMKEAEDYWEAEHKRYMAKLQIQREQQQKAQE